MWREGSSVNSRKPDMSRADVAWLTAYRQEREALAVARRLTHQAPALLGGWRLYRDTCARQKQDCLGTAQAGLKNASTLYGIDLLPGQTPPNGLFGRIRSEEHTSELQSLMRISYAVFCLKQKTHNNK